jgi:hypothetical protein
MAEAWLEEVADRLGQRLTAIPNRIDSCLRARTDLWSVPGSLFRLNDCPFLVHSTGFPFAFWAHTLDLWDLLMSFLLTLRAHPLHADTLVLPCSDSSSGHAGFGHPHHLLRHAIRFLLIRIAWCVDREFLLQNSAVEKTQQVTVSQA